MTEFIGAIVAAVVAGLILDLLRKKPLVKKLIPRSFSKAFTQSKNEKLLIYLSEGGTCRDPMAKVITQKLITERHPQLNLHVEAMALGPTSKTEVSYAARNAIKEIYGEDLLAGYMPRTVTVELLDKAHLILVMDRKLMMNKILPKTKTYVFKPFFGLDGDIKDPWPDGKDRATLTRYKERATEIKSILENNLEHLLEAVKV